MSAFAARSGPCSPRHADPRPPQREEIVLLDGATKKALEIGRNRLLVGALLFAMAFLVIVGRLVDVSLLQDLGEPRLAAATPAAPGAPRAYIPDGNGGILAPAPAPY